MKAVKKLRLMVVKEVDLAVNGVLMVDVLSTMFEDLCLCVVLELADGFWRIRETLLSRTWRMT